MAPNNKEIQLRKNCELYAYVLTSLGKEVPEYIEECAASYDELVECSSELGELIKGLDSESFERIVHNRELQEARDLANWWEMYQEADRLYKSLTIEMSKIR